MFHIKVASSDAYDIAAATTSLFYQDRLVEEGKSRKKDEVKADRNQHGGTTTLGLPLGGTSQLQYRVVLRCVCFHKCTIPAVLLKTFLAEVRDLLFVALHTSGENSTSNTGGPV